MFCHIIQEWEDVGEITLANSKSEVKDRRFFFLSVELIAAGYCAGPAASSAREYMCVRMYDCRGRYAKLWIACGKVYDLGLTLLWLLVAHVGKGNVFIWARLAMAAFCSSVGSIWCCQLLKTGYFFIPSYVLPFNWSFVLRIVWSMRRAEEETDRVKWKKRCGRRPYLWLLTENWMITIDPVASKRLLGCKDVLMTSWSSKSCEVVVPFEAGKGVTSAIPFQSIAQKLRCCVGMK